ncbi:choice-of-anchor J domain-containing protein [Cyclobacteriaceae bacterium]|nr:choice-of-anchor J domain-containing protein [Cyclobacteriaceae bacterium]
MRLSRLLFIAILFSVFDGLGQKRCGLDGYESPKETTEQFEEWLSNHQKNALTLFNSPGKANEIFQIPVVFHVIHRGEDLGIGTNVSDEKVLEQLSILNDDFGRLNSDQTLTPLEFLDVAADTEITFVLAKQDVEGLPTQGITRQQGTQNTYKFSEDEVLYAENYWPAEDYLNIYIADLEGYLGWANFPFSDLEGIVEINNDRLLDGVAIDYHWLGVNENTGSFSSYGRTLTHEVGHYFGLRHIWGNQQNCGADDYCEDTPLQSTSYSGACPSDAAISCETSDMYSNFMNYTDDACMNIFTQNQKERMHVVLNHSPRRNTLVHSHALDDPIIALNDLGIKTFNAIRLSDCNSLLVPKIEVRNYGTNVIENFFISFFLNDLLIETIEINDRYEPLEIATIDFQSITLNDLSNPVLTFEIGLVNQTEDGNLKNNILSSSLPNYATATLPFVMNFEGNIEFETTLEQGQMSHWDTVHLNTNDVLNRALSIDFTADTAALGLFDYLFTPNFNLSNYVIPQISFNYAYQSTGLDYEQDGLIVALSYDCGQNFYSEDYLIELYGPNLATVSSTSSSFFAPKDSSEWKNMTIDLIAFQKETNLQFAFIGQSSTASQLYLDDIMVVDLADFDYDLHLDIQNEVPLITCENEQKISLNLENRGNQIRSDISLNVSINNILESSKVITSLLEPGRSISYELVIEELETGLSNFKVWVSTPKGPTDQYFDNDTLQWSTTLNDLEVDLPIRLDFEEAYDWVITNQENNPIWEAASFEKNIYLMAKGYENTDMGNESWLISPLLFSDYLDSLSLQFDYAYKRTLNKNDRLRVLISVDCGAHFDYVLFDKNSEQLSDIISNEGFLIETNSVWQNVFIDLNDFLVEESLRIAFVFTNGNGNNLYLDNIEFINTGNSERPQFTSWATLYPNPVSDYLNVSFNLPFKQDVTVQLIDISGQIHQQLEYTQLLNETVQLEVQDLSGLFFLIITGPDEYSVEKVIIKN